MVQTMPGVKDML